ncbi:MAG: ATP-binding protein [Rhodospirillaceae bacterium]|nr:ATP-binding protein [Rhodospirillales bacterium]
MKIDKPDHADTIYLRKTAAMTESVLAAPEGRRIGQITGEPGTGKTFGTRYLVSNYEAVRICAWNDIAVNGMLIQIARALDADIKDSTAVDYVVNVVRERIRSKLLVVDESTHLRWQHLEHLRHFADEFDAAVILVGTPLLSKYMAGTDARIYLKQLTSRIGAKRVEYGNLSNKETTSNIAAPAFGTVPPEVAKAFFTQCNGNWREGQELVDACKRIMTANAITELNIEVIAAAAAEWGTASHGGK